MLDQDRILKVVIDKKQIFKYYIFTFLHYHGIYK
jgi:hypothetical protein